MIFSMVYRNLGRRPARTLVGVLGILLTMALLTAIQVALDSVSVSYLDLVSLQAGKADVLISRDNTDPFNPQPFDPEEVLAKPGLAADVRGFSPRLMGIVRLQHGGAEFDAVLLGLNLETERKLDISGLRPELQLAAGGCAVSKPLAERLAVKEGGSLRIHSPVSYGEKQLAFAGVLERQQVVPQQIRDYVVVNLADARELLGIPAGTHYLAGGLKDARKYYDPRDLHGSVLRLKSAGAAFAGELGLEYKVRLPKAAALTAFQDFTSPLRAVFGVFALLALVITGLLIYSLISVAVEERIREYAIFRTLGARRKHVWRLVLAESLVLCFAGVVPGVLCGALAAKVLVMLVSLALGGGVTGVGLEIRPLTLLLTIAGGGGLALASAMVPAMQATRCRLVDALDPLRRGQIAEPVAEESRGNRPLVVTGGALSALAAIVFFVLPSALFSGNPSLIGTILLCLLLLLLLGLTLVTLGVLPLLERLLLILLGGVLGHSSELVGRNLQRHRRRHTTTVLLFCLSVSLVVFVASLVALASRTALSLVEQSHGADLRMHAPQITEGSAKAELASLDGVEAVSEARFLHSRSEYGIAYDVVISDLLGMKHLWVVPYGVDEDLGRVLYRERLDYAEGDPSAILELNNTPSPGTNAYIPVVLSLAVARVLEVQAGDLVELSFRLGSSRSDKRFRVAAICRTLPGFENFRSRVAHAVGSGLLMPLKAFEEMTRSAPREALQALYFVRAGEDASVQKAVARKIREQFDLKYRFGVKCTAEAKAEATAFYWATQVFFGMLLAVAVIIAVFALIASMTTTVLERSREIGVLKALGMRRRELFRLLAGEAVTLTLSSGIAGAAIGFLLAWLFMLEAAMLMEIAVTFTLPYLTMVATLAISVFAGVLAAFIPARALLRKTAAEILRG